MQRLADEAIARERAAAAIVAEVLEPLGVASIDELRRRRDRWTQLRERRAEAARLAEQARTTRAQADAVAETFDLLAEKLVTPAATRVRGRPR